MLIAITDGELGDIGACVDQINRGMAEGVEYLFIGLDLTLEELRRQWPSGIDMIAMDSQHIGMLGDHLLDAVGRFV